MEGLPQSFLCPFREVGSEGGRRERASEGSCLLGRGPVGARLWGQVGEQWRRDGGGMTDRKVPLNI